MSFDVAVLGGSLQRVLNGFTASGAALIAEQPTPGAIEPLVEAQSGRVLVLRQLGQLRLAGRGGPVSAQGCRRAPRKRPSSFDPMADVAAGSRPARSAAEYPSPRKICFLAVPLS